MLAFLIGQLILLTFTRADVERPAPDYGSQYLNPEIDTGPDGSVYNVTRKATSTSKEVIQDVVKEAKGEFDKYERLFENPKLTKSFYKKWTPEGQQVSRDSRLLHLSLEVLEKKAEEQRRLARLKSGQDYSQGGQDYSQGGQDYSQGGQDYSQGGQDYFLGNAADYAFDKKDVKEVLKFKKTDRIKLILQQLTVQEQSFSGRTRGSDYMQEPAAHVSETTAASCHRATPVNCEPSRRYRSMNGECNNLEHFHWGRANTALCRAFPRLVNYEDGRETVTATAPLGNGKKMVLPNPRLLSKKLHRKPVEGSRQGARLNRKLTHLFMQYGQFLDHDITLTPEPELECCDKRLADSPRCANIRLDGDDFIDLAADEIYQAGQPTNQTCISFSRSDPACDTGVGRQPGTEDVREQLNSISAFVDGSNIYGSSKLFTNKLRANSITDHSLGYLEVHKNNFKDLPTRKQVGLENQFPSHEQHAKVSGDNRCVEHPGLVSMHTLWMNEHNRIAFNLQKQRPIKEYMSGMHMGLLEKDEFIFQEARRIVSAEMQQITYREFLPLVLGPDVMKAYDLNLKKHLKKPRGKGTKYDATVNPSIMNEFATVSFRFGHTLVNNQFMRTQSRHRPRDQDDRQTFALEDVFFNDEVTNCVNSSCTNHVNKRRKCSNTTCQFWSEDVLYGLTSEPAEESDMFLVPNLMDKLFLSRERHHRAKGIKDVAESSDLAARNIQRGRDHGLPSYNVFRRANKVFPLKSLDEFGIQHCSECLNNRYECDPKLLPDRECEHCVELGSYERWRGAYKRASRDRKDISCTSCVKRKCRMCEPGSSGSGTTRCSECFRNNIYREHRSDASWNPNTAKSICKRCIDSRSEAARRLDAAEVGIATEDFVRIGEAYCWNLLAIDAFTGALAETNVKGGQQGPTNTAIIADQFQKLLRGDRFFFSHRTTDKGKTSKGLEPSLRDEISRQTMASVICNNVQFYDIKMKDKTRMRMRYKAFKLRSKWGTCQKILFRAEIDFYSVARMIVQSHTENTCNFNLKRISCTSNVSNECENERQCSNKYRNPNYHCINSTCSLRKSQCFDDNDCQDGDTCSDQLCG